MGKLKTVTFAIVQYTVRVYTKIFIKQLVKYLKIILVNNNIEILNKNIKYTRLI